MASDYDMHKVILILAYEERGGEAVAVNAKRLANKYKSHFRDFITIQHPKDLPNELVGKGANITYAGEKVAEYVYSNGIDPNKVILTTLDSDNRPHPQYFANLSYEFILCDDPLHTSFQPVPMFLNNIWDAPAPMRVIATGNSFWMVITSLRPHLLRNFSSHAQGLQSLIDTDFWSVRTIVEDGHQFWRTYFRYDGHHDVVPIFLPIYQDAVLAEGYIRTFRAQFIQMRRWAWGASDIPYAIVRFFHSPHIGVITKLKRILFVTEVHFMWPTSFFILTISASIPSLVNPVFGRTVLGFLLPKLSSFILTTSSFMLVIVVYIDYKLRERVKIKTKLSNMPLLLIQWYFLPIISFVFSSLPALEAHTRMLLGKKLEYKVTEKL
jgi:hypothetical protein